MMMFCQGIKITIQEFADTFYFFQKCTVFDAPTVNYLMADEYKPFLAPVISYDIALEWKGLGKGGG
jgi:hypothetical protein